MNEQRQAASLDTGISRLKRKHSLSNDGDSDSGEGDHTTSSVKRKGKRPAKDPVLCKLGTDVEGSEFLAGYAELDDLCIDVQDSEPDDNEPARNASAEESDLNSVISARSDDSDWQDHRVEPRRSMRRKDIAWPAYPSRSTQCCDTCNSMTGTAAGLQALLDPRGYRHLNWYDLQETASMGCALCQAIWDVTEHENWEFEEDGCVVQDEIRVTGSFTELIDVEGGPPPEHPMAGRFFDEIAVHIPQDGGRRSPQYGEGEVWHLVTFAGKPPLHSARIILC